MPRTYANKVRNAQEAHEAIRPAGDRFRHPDEVAGEVPSSEARVYEMIWRRTVASQMTDAVGETVRVRATVDVWPEGSEEARAVTLAASGTVISHQGFRRAYEVESDDADDEEAERVLPEVAVGTTAVSYTHLTLPTICSV